MKKAGPDVLSINLGEGNTFLNDLKNRELLPIEPVGFLSQNNQTDVEFYPMTEMKKPIRSLKTSTIWKVELTGYVVESNVTGKKTYKYHHVEVSFEVEISNDFKETTLVNNSINYGVLANVQELPAYLKAQAQAVAGPAS